MKYVKTFESFNEVINEAKRVNIPSSLEDIFILEKKFPFGLPSDVADFYVTRADGKTGASKWSSFEELITANPGVRFGTYANADRISIFTTLKNGKILVMDQVYIQN